jgi:hypothetical protein
MRSIILFIYHQITTVFGEKIMSTVLYKPFLIHFTLRLFDNIL